MPSQRSLVTLRRSVVGGKGSRGTGVGVPGQGNPRIEGGFPENTVCEHQAYMVGGLRTREIP